MSHTPGPWKAEEVGAGEIFIIVPDLDAAGQQDGWKSGICEMSKDGDWDNANLIAAAPEMYEALVGVVRGHDYEERGVEYRHICDACDLARAVIAKAEGR